MTPRDDADLSRSLTRRTVLRGAAVAGVLGPATLVGGGATPPRALAQEATPETSERATSIARQLRSATFSDEKVDLAIEALAWAGIPVYADAAATEPVIPVDGTPSPLRLLRWQVHNMALELSTRGWRRGSEFDKLAPPPEGAPPPSFVLGGYAATAQTPGGELARAVLATRNWKRSPNIRFPSFVLALCGADLARDTAAEAASVTSHALAPAPAARWRVRAADGTCSAVKTFIDDTIAAVFAAMKLQEPASGAGKILVGIWNFLVDLGQNVVEGLVATLTAPVVAAIKAIAAVVGIGSLVLTALQAWSLRVEPDPIETRLGIGDEVITGAVPATVDFGGISEWPADIADCAAALGGPLPPLTPTGAPVTWSVSQNPEGLIQVDDLPKELDAGATAALTYQTGTESAKDAEGEEQSGSVRFDVTVDRPDLTQLRDTIANAAFSALPDVIEQIVVPILGPTVKDVLAGLIELVDVTGTATIGVIYHIPPEDEKPPAGNGDGEQAANPNAGCYKGAWVAEDFGELWADYYAGSSAATYNGTSGSLGWAFGELVAVNSENGFEISLTITSDAGVSDVILRLIGTFLGTYTATNTRVNIQWDNAQSGTFTALVSTLGIVAEVDITDLWVGTSGEYLYDCSDGRVRLTSPDGKSFHLVKP